MKRVLKWMGCMGVIILFTTMCKVYGDGLPVYQSYDNYEVKRVTNTLYGIAGTTVNNAWEWDRHVRQICIVRKSSHPIYIDFQVKVSSFGYTVPTVSDTYCINGAMASDQLNNTFEFDIESDEFSIYVSSNNFDGVENVPTPDIRIFGFGR